MYVADPIIIQPISQNLILVSKRGVEPTLSDFKGRAPTWSLGLHHIN